MDALIKKYSTLLPKNLIDEIVTNTPSKTPTKSVEEIFKRVFEEYHSSLAEPGESVGILSAESIGEPSTQMTLNTFHLAGVSEVNVTTGLPRIIEVLDGRKNISTASMEIYLLSPYKEGKDIRQIAAQIKETSLKSFVKEIDISLASMSMIITLDSKKIDTAKLNTKKVVKLIEKSIKGFIISDDDNTIIIKSKTDSINDLYKVKEKVKDIFVCGIKGMKQVIPIKRDEEHVIVTSGSNIKEVFKLDFVDKTRTISNDIFEVESYFGVEAARQLIIDEINKVLDGQGIPVDVRHIMLVADTMTMSGRVLGINRYGIVKEKPSVLARASFETPIKHLISAALTGERDELNSVIENVMLNQVVPVGTGLPQLITRKIDPSLLAAVKKEHSKEEKLKSVTKKETKEEVAEKKPVKETKATVKKTAEKKTATKTVAKKATTKKTTKKVAAKK